MTIQCRVVKGEILFGFEDERQKNEPDFVAGRRAEHVGVMRAFHFMRHNEAYWFEKFFCFTRFSAACFPAAETFPFARLLPPRMIFLPTISTSFTVLVSPGSKRTAVPAGMSRRLP